MNFNFTGDSTGRTRIDPEMIARIRSWIEEQFSLPCETSILVTELKCYEEGCPPVETVIAILDDPGRPRTLKIHKPMADVTRGDLARLAGGHGDHPH